MNGPRTKLLTALFALALAPAAHATGPYYGEDGAWLGAADDPCVSFGSTTTGVSDPTTGIADDPGTGKPRWKHTRTRTCANGMTLEEVEWLQYVSEWQPDPPGAPPPDPCVEAGYTDEGWNEGTC